jgi:hypothetical protein
MKENKKPKRKTEETKKRNKRALGSLSAQLRKRPKAQLIKPEPVPSFPPFLANRWAPLIGLFFNPRPNPPCP